MGQGIKAVPHPNRPHLKATVARVIMLAPSGACGEARLAFRARAGQAAGARAGMAVARSMVSIAGKPPAHLPLDQRP